MIKAISIAALGLVCGAVAAAPVRAQNVGTRALPIDGSASAISADAQNGVSLAALLQLQPAQSERLSRLYDDFSARRRTQQEKIARLQNQRGQGRDAGRAARLERDIEAARQKILADLGATRVKARQTLPPVQRSQLDSLANESRFRLRRDRFYQLLLAPGAETEPVAERVQGSEARRNWLEARQWAGENNARRANGVGSYGVYSGYGYGGPQAGVYGGYNQGAVGVHGGIGLGGPSIGVSIGRVFGVGRR